MKCARCGAEMKTEVTEQLMGWWPHTDSAGVLHRHNPNRFFEYLVCANGHGEKTGKSWFEPCPACGWVAGVVEPQK